MNSARSNMNIVTTEPISTSALYIPVVSHAAGAAVVVVVVVAADGQGVTMAGCGGAITAARAIPALRAQLPTDGVPAVVANTFNVDPIERPRAAKACVVSCTSDCSEGDPGCAVPYVTDTTAVTGDDRRDTIVGNEL